MGWTLLGPRGQHFYRGRIQGTCQSRGVDRRKAGLLRNRLSVRFDGMDPSGASGRELQPRLFFFPGRGRVLRNLVRQMMHMVYRFSRARAGRGNRGAPEDAPLWFARAGEGEVGSWNSPTGEIPAPRPGKPTGARVRCDRFRNLLRNRFCRTACRHGGRHDCGEWIGGRNRGCIRRCNPYWTGAPGLLAALLSAFAHLLLRLVRIERAGPGGSKAGF